MHTSEIAQAKRLQNHDKDHLGTDRRLHLENDEWFPTTIARAKRDLGANGLRPVRGVHDELRGRGDSPARRPLGHQERLQVHQALHSGDDLEELRTPVLLLRVSPVLDLASRQFPHAGRVDRVYARS